MLFSIQSQLMALLSSSIFADKHIFSDKTFGRLCPHEMHSISVVYLPWKSGKTLSILNFNFVLQKVNTG